ncbi:ubiquitin-like protein Pup [Streptomyces sp. NPDC013178]|uniref:ubiquitin-like protein Pup n=1 Tax=Streptomyces sp. NPDC013178 TaxID=3155118 RepID=UPI0033D5DF77
MAHRHAVERRVEPLQHRSERRRHQVEDDEQDVTHPAAETGTDTEPGVSADAEDLLDEIDDVLGEIENPEAWLSSYVQKGGE